MKLSIVVPSFQQAKFLEATLSSLANQRNVADDELEIILIDGGSNDGSIEIIRQFSPRLSYWVSEPDRGQTHALCKGFARASGDVLGWLCSDDLLEPDAARSALDYLAEHPEQDFFYGDALWIDAEGNVVRAKKEIPFNWFIWTNDHNYIPQPSAFWRRSLYDACGGLNETLHCAMDSDLFAKFASRSRPRHLKQVLSRVRVYPEQKTQKFLQVSLREHEQACLQAGSNTAQLLPRPARKMVAKGMRVGWKLATGCYW
jgi:glycosyltransferase involved in cell wall biosynthesis